MKRRTCRLCGQRLSAYPPLVQSGGAVHPSAAKRHGDLCVECALPLTYHRGYHGQLAYVEPRYCTCTGATNEDLDTPDQCADCLRRLRPVA